MNHIEEKLDDLETHQIFKSNQIVDEFNTSNGLNDEDMVIKYLEKSQDQIKEDLKKSNNNTVVKPTLASTNSILSEVDKDFPIKNLLGCTPESFKNYALMLFWTSGFCGRKKLFSKLLEIDEDLRIWCSNDMKKNFFLTNKELNSKVLIAAIKEREEDFLYEMLILENLSYNITEELIVALLENNMTSSIRALFKQEVINTKSMFRRSVKRTSYFMGHQSRNEDPNFFRETLQSLMSNEVNAEKSEIIMNNTLQAISSATNKVSSKINIVVTFEEILPHLVKFGSHDLIDLMLQLLGSPNKNIISQFLNYGLEQFATKYHQRDQVDINPRHILIALNKRFFEFLCSINDETEQYYFFLDDIFSLILEIIKDGNYMTEMLVVLKNLPFQYWKEIHSQRFLDTCRDLLNQDPLTNRLIYSSNPILACALMSYFLRKLSRKKFNHFGHDFETVSEKLDSLALSIQKSMSHKALTTYYLAKLPTRKTMLDYIIICKIKSLVESKDVDVIIQKYWNQEYVSNGKTREYSCLKYMMKTSKNFTILPTFKSDYTKNFEFQLESTAVSGKVAILTELFYLVILYFWTEHYIYTKQRFFDIIEKDPNLLFTLPSYFIDANFAINQYYAYAQLIILMNYWVALLYRNMAIIYHKSQMKQYNQGHYFAFIMLSLLFIMIMGLKSYEDEYKNRFFIIANLVGLRLSIFCVICTVLLVHGLLGVIISVVYFVLKQFMLLLILVCIVTLFTAEYFQNFYRNYQPFSTVSESFFTLIELLFGSITMPEVNEDFDGNLDYYYAVNISMTLWTFMSNVMCVFLLIAYMTQIYNKNVRDARYSMTTIRYQFLSFQTTTTFKGFYNFPGFLCLFTIPLLPFIKYLNGYLIKFQYYILIFPCVLFHESYLILFRYLPGIYTKFIKDFIMNKYSSKKKIYYLILWLLLGPIYILVIGIWDLIRIFILCFKNIDHEKTNLSLLKDFLCGKEDDNALFLCYNVMKEALKNYIKDNPINLTININTYLDYIRKYINIDLEDSLEEKMVKSKYRRSKHKKKFTRANLISDIIDKHPKSIKKYIKLLENMLNIKSVKYTNFDEAMLDVDVVQELLDHINISNVSYYKVKNVSSIQIALSEIQNVDQILILKRLDDIEGELTHILNEIRSLRAQLKSFCQNHSRF